MSEDHRPHLSQLRQLDLNLFVVLDAIYSEGSLTAAGRRLGLTQPAMSHALRRLRLMLGDELFGRQGTRMTPSPFTRDIIPEVRRALLIFEGKLQVQRRFDPSTATQTFRLGLSERTETIVIPPLVGQLAREAPGVSVVSVNVRADEIEARLASGDIDIAVWHPAPIASSIRRRMLAPDEFVVLVRADHPACADPPLTLEKYLALDHVSVSRGGVAMEDHELSRQSLRRTIVADCRAFGSALAAALHSDAAITLSRAYAEQVNRNGEFVAFGFPLETPPLAITLYWHGSNQENPANSWLRQTISLLMLPE